MSGQHSATERRRLARQARRHGYYNRGPDPDYGGYDRLELACPVCRVTLATCLQHRTFPAKPGKPANIDPVTGERTIFRLETVIEALDREVMEHLTSWCEGRPAQ